MISKKLSIVHCQLSIILAFLPLSVAYAQQDSTLNRTVVVENEYNPNIMDASKINVLPRVEEPAVMKKGIEYATRSKSTRLNSSHEIPSRMPSSA